MEETTARGFAELREALASRTGTRPEDWFPVFKARYGMQVAFDAVRSVRGDGSPSCSPAARRSIRLL